ncbi:MAG: hypothetical protein CM15mP74_24200 [Halieaceae bacterium]|nr:MAG: hypothetical protein CM15mP74_24200 [Halieaceae bacterium]
MQLEDLLGELFRVLSLPSSASRVVQDHAGLCKGVFDDGDLPDWEPRFDGDKGFGHVAEDATTWTMDGKTELPLFEGLTDQERDDGLIFMDIIGTFYLVAHADYVRTVR